MVISLRHISLLLCLTLAGFVAVAQSANPSNSTESGKKTKAKDLEKSLETGTPEDVAANYEKLAAELSAKGENDKAEEYLKSALEIYKKEKNKEKIASVQRELAKLNEKQKKYSDAIRQYQQAAEISIEKNTVQLNTNDALRLQNAGNPDEEIKLYQSNIELLESEGKNEETAEFYIKKAEAELNADKKTEAKESISRAMEAKNAMPAEALNLKSNVTKLFVEKSMWTEALELGTSNLAEAVQMGNVTRELEQRDYLAEVYRNIQDPPRAEEQWIKAYEVALANGRTREATELVRKLANHFAQSGRQTEAFNWHNRFLTDFDQFIKADSSLVDAKIFEVTESRIRQLETERALKDELLSGSRRFNFVLIGSVGLMFVLMTLLARAVWRIRSRNRKIALQALRREMNPHFLFNSLNSVNRFIAENDEPAANKFLTSYSTLMRKMMESGDRDFIRLSDELAQLTQYLELEHLRFRDRFDFEIRMDDHLDTEALFVPNMLIQPHLENAIWHGLRYMEDKGTLLLQIIDTGSQLRIIIEDNGIGRAESERLKTHNQRLQQSRGLANTRERIQLLNRLYGTAIRCEASDGHLGRGTRITLTCPKLTRIPQA